MTKRKYIIISSIVVVAILGIVKLRTMSLSSFLDGEDDAVTRGDLVIPVSASGVVEPNKLIEIKSKASGEVARIPVVEGQLIRKGDLLLELDPVDEQRNLERAQADLERAEASLEKARISLEDQEKQLPLNTRAAEARVEEIKAQLQAARVDWEKTDRLFHRTPPVASEQEWILRKSAYERLQANLKQAEIEHERATVTQVSALKSAKEDVRLAAAALESARKQYEDAKERLKETKVYARQPGIVYSVRVREGEVIQSGKTSLTGGTPLMYLADTSKMVVIAQVDEADIGAVRKVAPEYARPGQVRRVSLEEMTGDTPSAGGAATTQSSAEALIGQRVKVNVEAYRSETYEGVIERILPEPRKLNNVLTFDVRIVLLGGDVQKLLGLQADVEFTADRVENVLRVKNEAVFSEGKETYVYVPVRNPSSNRWDEKKVPVKIGVTDGTYTEIRSGLSEDIKKVWIKRPRKTDREREEEEQA
ncbi:MAG: HlyD family efflux transporter periplasmic adaptor subunit [Phycisphaerae bacterium]|nr:HlyD family efflux transporter periplasmic adaptor subunit [Phycisphaerae bacterium]